MNASTSRLPVRRFRGDEGAVLVEFALFAPILVVLGMGLMEFGLVWREQNILHTATRAAARVGGSSFASGGEHEDADLNILLAAKAGLAQIDPADITKVVIYSASTSDGEVPAACAAYDPGAGAGSPGGVECNVYSGAYLAALTDASSTESVDDGWEPGSRDANEQGGLDYLGVWIEVDHTYVTGIFGTSITVSERDVMGLEPCTLDRTPTDLCKA